MPRLYIPLASRIKWRRLFPTKNVNPLEDSGDSDIATTHSGEFHTFFETDETDRSEQLEIATAKQ